MKAKINPMNGVLLSIGMIVKNEEKFLAGCLERLKPLLDAVPSELIIADTGSADRTAEIAERYTDKVFSFAWVNDFAAARNATLDRAAGEWYMQIDADEWLENAEALAAFFQKKQKADFAAYHLKSVLTRDGVKTESDFTPARIFRRAPHRRYHGKIHENVPIEGEVAMLDAVAIHYGYSTVEQLKGKSERNLPMLLERLEEEPQNAQVYLQLITEYGIWNNDEKSFEYAQRGLALYKNKPLDPLGRFLYREYFGLLTAMGEDQRMLGEAAEYLEKKPQATVGDLDICAYIVSSALMLELWGCVIQYAGHYFALIKQWRSHTLDDSDLVAGAVKHMQPQDENQVLACWLTALFKLTKYGKMLEMSAQFDFSFRHDPQEKSAVVNLVQAAYWENRLELVEVWKRRALEAQNTQIVQLMEEVLRTMAGLRRHPLVTLLTSGDRLTQLAGEMEMEEVAAYLQGFREAVADYPALVRDYYFAAPPAETSAELYWEICLCELALLGAGEARGGYLPLFERYCRSLGVFVFNLYSEAVLTEEEIGLLPRGHRFGFYALQAFGARDAGDLPAFLRLLVEAGRQYPVMLEYVRQLVAFSGKAY